MSEIIKLKVQGKVTQEVVGIDPKTNEEVKTEQVVEFVSHGNFDADLKPNSVIETPSRKFADWLINTYGLKELKSEGDGDGNNEPENVFEQQYPAEFPGRKTFIAKEIAFETARNLNRDQLIGIDGIAEKTADKILVWFQEHPVENLLPIAPEPTKNSTEGENK